MIVIIIIAINTLISISITVMNTEEDETEIKSEEHEPAQTCISQSVFPHSVQRCVRAAWVFGMFVSRNTLKHAHRSVCF